jgi:hypothetical protein
MRGRGTSSVMASFTHFPDDSEAIPIPSQMLGALLEDIKDMAELKCTLRFFWHLEQEEGEPRAVTAKALLEDKVLQEALGSIESISQGLQQAINRGTLLEIASAGGELAYAVHTPDNRQFGSPKSIVPPLVIEDSSVGDSNFRTSIISLYEKVIGKTLTAMTGEELKDVEDRYPWKLIQEVFREAELKDIHDWRYINKTLESRFSEGRGRTYGTHREPRRDSQTIAAKEFIAKVPSPFERRRYRRG